MEKEVWKDVPGYEGLYQVSNLGNVRSLDRHLVTGDRTHFYHGRPISSKFGESDSSDRYVGLSKNGERKIHRVDVLVASVFIANPDGYRHVRHIDGRLENCRASNLEWIGPQECICDPDTDEIWKDIPNYEGYYQASNIGRIRGLNREVPYLGGTRVVRGRVLTPSMDIHGYPHVMMTKENVQRFESVHRMVALAFLPNPDNLPEVDHIDGNPSNSSLENLRWVTRKENVAHIKELGHFVDCSENFRTQDARRKWKAKACKPVMRSDGKRYESISAAALDAGCCRRTIAKAAQNPGMDICGFTYQFI